jgi:hypothetical protein
MNCCIMLSPKYSLNLCTCLIWFEFELKILEKIKRKAIRNSEKKRKTHLSPSRRSQAQRGRARPPPQTGGAPPVSGDFFPPPPPSCFLSLSTSLCPVGPVCRRQLPLPAGPSRQCDEPFPPHVCCNTTGVTVRVTANTDLSMEC